MSGHDATVAYGSIDFRFKNNKSTPIKIISVANGGVLNVKILGKKDNNNRVELYTNTLETYNFPVEEKINPNLKPGEKVVKQNGATGYKINATKVVKDANGNVLRNEFLGTSTYRTIKKIVEVGPEGTPVSGEITEVIPPEAETEKTEEETEKTEDESEKTEEEPEKEEIITPEEDEEEETSVPETETPSEEEIIIEENNEV